METCKPLVAATRSLVVALASAFVLTATALAQRQPAGDTLPPLAVTGKALQTSLDVFVSKVTGAYVWADDHPIARWKSSICPLVAGLPRRDGQQLFDELT